MENNMFKVVWESCLKSILKLSPIDYHSKDKIISTKFPEKSILQWKKVPNLMKKFLPSKCLL